MISALSSPTTLSARFRFNQNHVELGNTLRKLSTGKRINSGKDDPAGLITSEQLAAKIKSLEAESRSVARADASANVTDGNLSQIGSMLGELNALVVASANTAGLSDAEIAANQMQIDSLTGSIERFTGDAVASLSGFNMPDGGNAEVEALLTEASAAARTLASGAANSLTGDLAAAQAAIATAITDVASARGKVGAFQKDTLGPQLNSNAVAIENLMASRSRIVDTDYAVETSNLSRLQVLTESSAKVLKIAQQQSRTILDLLA